MAEKTNEEIAYDLAYGPGDRLPDLNAMSDRLAETFAKPQTIRAINHDMHTLRQWQDKRLPSAAEDAHAASLADEEDLERFGIAPEDIIEHTD